MELLPVLRGGMDGGIGKSEISFYINDLSFDRMRGGGEIVVTRNGSTQRDRNADAMVVLSPDCPVQIFPPDLSREPILLRSPVTPVAFRVALEHVANRLGWTGRGAARPGFA